jgi:cell division FtsZ-interacting protein ZapD
VILHILRGSAVFVPKTAAAGHYSQNIKAAKDCQLVRITLARNSWVYPEISAGKQHLNIRFMDSRNHPVNDETITFELSVCY